MEGDIRLGTKKGYASRQGMFAEYCADVGCEVEYAPVEVVMNFLAILSETLHYSSSLYAGLEVPSPRSTMGLGPRH